MTETVVDSAVIRKLWSSREGFAVPVRRREGGQSPVGPDYFPAEAQVRAAPNELTIYIELPGARASDVRVEWDDAGVIHVMCPDSDRGRHYYRAFDFALAFDARKTTARFALGLLTLVVPRRRREISGVRNSPRPLTPAFTADMSSRALEPARNPAA